WPYDVALVGAMAEAADAFGYDMVGIADTPGNAMDPWVATTLLAARTRRARVAVCVSNLVTRHPAVSAASIASVELLAPGRAVLGIGVGSQRHAESGCAQPAGERAGGRRRAHQGAAAGPAGGLPRRHRPSPVGETLEPGLSRRLASTLAQGRGSPRRRCPHPLRSRPRR